MDTTKRRTRNDIASLAGLNPEGVSQGIQEIQKRVHADRDVRRDKEKARVLGLKKFTRPGRGISSPRNAFGNRRPVTGTYTLA